MARWRLMRRVLIPILCSVLLLSLLCGCGTDTKERFELVGADRGFDLMPTAKPDGSPYRIAVMDEGPPIESSRLWLRGLCEGLQEMGYLSPDVDLDAAPEEYEDFYEYVRAANTETYVAFDDECYFVYGTEEDEALADLLRERAAAGLIDAFVVTGTLPGTFLKELGLGLPVLVSFASDPVASGIIDSPEDTGDPCFWALVEPQPAERQLLAYESLFHMKKLIILASEEAPEIGFVPEYRSEAERLGVECVILSVREEQQQEPGFADWLRESTAALLDQGADALLVTYGSILEEQAVYLADLLADRRIPYLIGDAEEMVRGGGLVLMSCFDYENYGRRASQILSNVFHGGLAGDQPCVYSSSLRIVLNLDVAERTGYLTDFAFLRSVDKIYRSEGL